MSHDFGFFKYGYNFVKKLQEFIEDVKTHKSLGWGYYNYEIYYQLGVKLNYYVSSF